MKLVIKFESKLVVLAVPFNQRQCCSLLRLFTCKILNCPQYLSDWFGPVPFRNAKYDFLATRLNNNAKYMQEYLPDHKRNTRWLLELCDIRRLATVGHLFQGP